MPTACSRMDGMKAHTRKKKSVMRVGSRTPATSKMEIFVKINKESVKNSHKELQLRCYSGPRTCLSHLIIDIVSSFMRQLECSSNWSQMH